MAERGRVYNPIYTKEEWAVRYYRCLLSGFEDHYDLYK